MVAPDTRDTITSLLDKMRPVLLAAKIPASQVNMKSGRFRIDTCSKAFDWLHDLYMSDDYKNVYNIWKLVSAETWERYKIYGIEGLKEQEIIEEYGKALLLAWRNKRPKLFGPNKVVEEEEDNSQTQGMCRP